MASKYSMVHEGIDMDDVDVISSEEESVPIFSTSKTKQSHYLLDHMYKSTKAPFSATMLTGVMYLGYAGMIAGFCIGMI